MTFAKLAAEVVTSASADDEARREEEEGRATEWLKWAIAAGVLTAGAAAVYYNRDKLKEVMDGRIFDSRTNVDRFLEDKVTGVGAGGIGAAVGAASAGPLHSMRRSRFLHGDMAGHSTLPGIARNLTGGEGPAASEIGKHFGSWGSQSIRGPDGKLLSPEARATALGRMILEATSPGGESSPFALLNRDDPLAGIDPDQPGAAAMRNARGELLFDPDSGPGSYIKARTTGMGTARSQLDRILRNASTIGQDTLAARAKLDTGTPYAQLDPRSRSALLSETEFGRRFGNVELTPDGYTRQSLGLHTLPNVIRSSRDVAPKGVLGRGVKRAIGGGLAATVLSSFW